MQPARIIGVTGSRRRAWTRAGNIYVYFRAPISAASIIVRMSRDGVSSGIASITVWDELAPGFPVNIRF
jgi:hypothetical protein